MTSIDPVPIYPADIGRDNDIDGILGTYDYLSEVKVINITPHEVSEIKTCVITLTQDAFPVKRAGEQHTPISVFSDDVERGYVQWEPMGDLYPATQENPLGSYKYLRVKWDCYLPAGSNTANYAVSGSIPGPYQYYIEKTYVFRAVEPQTSPTFTLTPGVLSALGYLGCDRPTYFEFSAHGYVNRFDFFNGLYGQDKQAAFPDGSALLPAERDVIYDRNFSPLGSIHEAPNAAIECLAKEYTVRGRIVPELDYDGAAFEVIQQGMVSSIGNEVSSIFSTSGRDAPPFWYNFNYELQHQKNIIPFTFLWGVSLLTYDTTGSPYDPRGAEADIQDRFGRVTGTPKESSNNGARRRSQEWVNYFKTYNLNEVSKPNIFHSQDDITFSIIGPDAVCHASSVNVCAVYEETTPESLKKTIINWFDKRNQTWYDVEVFGFNWLPSYSAWVLRGCLHVNSNYLPPINLSVRDQNSQLSNRLEKTWALDQNFADRKLFTIYKNAHEKPPDELIQQIKGYADSYQTAAKMVTELWETEIDIDVTYIPQGVTRNSDSRNPFFGQPDFYSKTTSLLKNLHDPWAVNPIGLCIRAGVPGEQPGFSVIGLGGTLAAAGLPDARFLEACIDLEWQRATIEVERDGRIVNQFGPQWLMKTQVAEFRTLDLSPLNDFIQQTDPSYNAWRNKSIDSPEFQGDRNILDNDSILGYVGTNPAMHGSQMNGRFGRGYNSDLYGLGKDKGKTDAFSTLMNTFKGGRVRYNNLAHPLPKHQNAYGYPDINSTFYSETFGGFDFSHSAYGHALSYAMISGDKIVLRLIDHYMRVIMITHNDCEHSRILFGGGDYKLYKGDAGRNEGRPLHGLIGGIGITRDRDLAERAIYLLNRRFWNSYHVQNFEHTPTGIPGRPWVSVWYPPWGGGVDLRIDAQGIPYEIPVGSAPIANSTRSTYDSYINAFDYQGDLALRIYNSAGLRIRDLNPNFVSSNAASWNWNAAGGVVDYTWVDKYADLRKSGNFLASGLSSIDKIPGGPAELVSGVNYRLKYRFTDKNDPFRYIIADPPAGFVPNYNRNSGNYISSIPEVTGFPDTASLTEVRSCMATQYTAQSYQHSLIFPFISPLRELFYNYSTIYRNRAVLGMTPNFPTKFNSYSMLADELEDCSERVKEYFVRVAKSVAKNLLLKIDDNSVLGAGQYGIGYSYSPYSSTRLYENFSDAERSILLDGNGRGEFPTLGVINYSEQVDPPPAPKQIKEYIFRAVKDNDCLAGAYLQGINYGVYSKGVLGGSPYGTAMWAANILLWAWDIVFKFGDLTDSDDLAVLERLRIGILGWFGPEKFNLDLYRTQGLGALRDTFYQKFWGDYGWPNPGTAPNRTLSSRYGDYEIISWLVGATEEIWRDRTLNLTTKVIQGTIVGETELSSNFEVTTADRRIYTYEAQPSALLNPGKGLYVAYNNSDAIRNTIPHTIQKVDYSMSSFYANGSYSSDFDFTDFERVLNLGVSRNCQSRIKVWIDYPRANQNGIPLPWAQPPALPGFLSATVEQWQYVGRLPPDGSYDYASSGYIPDYNSPILRAELFRLIDELGRRYDGDPRIVEFQVGLAGHWGEWNNYQAHTTSLYNTTDPNDPRRTVAQGFSTFTGNLELLPFRFLPTDLLNALILRYDQAFTITPVTGRYLDQLSGAYTLPSAPTELTSVSVNIGQHDDSFAWLTLADPGTQAYLYYTMTQVNHYGLVDRWRTKLQSGEIRPEIQTELDVFSNTYRGLSVNYYVRTPQNIFDCIRAYHPTLLSAGTLFNEYWRKLQPNQFDKFGARNSQGQLIDPVIPPTEEQINNIRNGIYLLGYNFFIQNAIIPTDTNRGQNFEITVNIKNIGVAPFYQNWPVMLRFENGGDSYEIQTDWNISSVMPDQSVDFTLIVNGIEFSQNLPNATNVSARLYIKKPAAFLRDITFMNAEHIDSTPYMDLGQLTLVDGDVKYIEGEISGVATLDSTVKSITTKIRYPRDHGNESFYPTLGAPDIVNIPGGSGGSKTQLIIGSLSGASDLITNRIIANTLIEGLVEGYSLLDGYVTSAVRVEGLVDMFTELEASDTFIDLEIIGPNFTTSGSSELSLVNFNIFKALPPVLISGESSSELDKFSAIIAGLVTIDGSSDYLANFTSQISLDSLVVSGGTEVEIDQIFLLLLEGLISGETIPQASVFVSAAPRERLSEFGDISVDINESSFSKSDFAEEVAKVDRFYTGLQGRQKQNFEVSLFKELSRRSIGDNKVTEIYKDTLKYLISKFSEFIYINDQNEVVEVPCWHGSSERVIAKMKQESNITLPVISVYRSGNKVDEGRRRSSSLIVYEKYWDKEKQRAVRVASIAPNPINISYKLNVWTKYQEDMDHITEQVHRLFNPDLEVRTKFNSTTKAFMLEESENTDTSLPDGQDRVIRKVFTIDVESYVPNPKFLITNTGKIEAFNAEVCIPIK